ncbi:protease-like activity factor [Candidatus Protochlamydia naegleriophila]|uniref:Protease-like activity factor n=1 Tax=Candidatus Protochlamydia naegleriophila TaxID=389348 RepID=A0A0U5ERK9_9BACT|nr:protease-like activity factor CPAF [Candidatus Protochlamydia naegleriophila]CUI16800.1 protease-like activity factor [Candidatus Protochlamydia naegleriophila]
MGIKCLLVKLLGVCAFSIVASSAQAQLLGDQKKAQMIEDLTVIKKVFHVGYAPLEWKKDYAGWDIDQEFEKSKQLILDTPQISVKDFQIIVKNFIASTRDYHADVVFYSTETASLPFGVKSAEGRYFIDWIDPQQMPFYFYEIQVGDELIAFDERPIGDVINELKEIGNKNSNPFTDQALAEMKLTSREGQLGDLVPRGAVSITVQPAAKEGSVTYQLIWNYTPEKIVSLPDIVQSIHALFSPAPGQSRPKTLMMNSAHREMVKKISRDGALGARKSFVPVLGPRTWVHDVLKKNENLCWYAYVYETPQGQSIGYIRIPHYVGKEAESKAFGELLTILEEKTDALVIDQLHNVGGYVTFQYELASMLATTPLKTPKHRIKITQKDVMEAYQILEVIENIQAGFDLIVARMEEEGEEEDEPLNYQYLLFLKEFYEFIINEWNAGRTLTHPTHLEGCDWIHPHSEYRYTKPILMLINELDFSGGDFMPAMMQDNGRALLFGKRTSGAGGFVFQNSFPNQNGISGFSYTGSIAERPHTFQKIENLGITPDIEYSLTVEDLQYGYQGYIEAVNEAVQLLFKK